MPFRHCYCLVYASVNTLIVQGKPHKKDTHSARQTHTNVKRCDAIKTLCNANCYLDSFEHVSIVHRMHAAKNCKKKINKNK